MTADIKADKGIGIEGAVARWYDRTTRRDLPEFERLAARIAGLVPPGAAVLEVAPGPGFLAIALAKRGLSVAAVDISKTFVEIARRNAAAAGVAARFELGDAAALPLADASVALVVCRAAFKNFSRPVAALSEMRRVLRPGGTALLIDLRRDASMAAIKDYIRAWDMGWFNTWLTMLTFRTMLIKRAYSLEEVRRMAREAGWAEPRIEATPLGFEASTTVPFNLR